MNITRLFFLGLFSVACACNIGAKDSSITISQVSRFFDNFHCVEKNKLYRSRQLSARKLARYIKKHGIKSVINLRGNNPHTRWWQREKKILKKLGVNFYNIPMNSYNLTRKKHVLTLLDLYRTAQKPILIHCLSGADRTGEAAALWKLDQEGKSKRQALKQLSLRYGHMASKKPQKQRLINLWKGYDWVKEQYDHRNYSSLFLPNKLIINPLYSDDQEQISSENMLCYFSNNGFADTWSP